MAAKKKPNPPVTDLGALPVVLTVPEAAAVLRLGKSATYEMIQRGELYGVKVGRRIIVPRSAIAKLLGEDEE